MYSLRAWLESRHPRLHRPAFVTGPASETGVRDLKPAAMDAGRSDAPPGDASGRPSLAAQLAFPRATLPDLAAGLTQAGCGIMPTWTDPGADVDGPRLGKSAFTRLGRLPPRTQEVPQ